MPPRPTLEPDDLVTPTQAAELLGVDPNLVRVWIHRVNRHRAARHARPLAGLRLQRDRRHRCGMRRKQEAREAA